MYQTLGFKLFCQVFCPASAFVTADRDEARNPQRFIHVSVGQNSWTAPLKTGRGEGIKTMKKNRTKYYFTVILLIHILVYFFKIDKDVFAFQEYVNRPNQTYTEQPYSMIFSYLQASFYDQGIF